ncbi:hypothetical protein FEM48_Zijuj09G0155800 [Ziziphus jujuba var. spinosa]|uniref:MULE transposase domain-containing protein n=1 Tax=Ziziphus jujuba var. spinosa TaxID=714518 RepID=A0A978UTU0_ZIZJJ|nr:hypothetical protein FEM48_Zijuj09G0155800 [Ziziphus jujuba var. spinosa]
MIKSQVKPKEILITLKRRDENNVSTMKTIYNARHRGKLIEKAGKSQMQQLLSKLCKLDYVEWHRSNEEIGSVTDVFWAHPLGITLLQVFPRVLIMDCTYKTNRHRLPLLEIIGVPSTELTFSVPFVYLQSEREENYIWALEKLKRHWEAFISSRIVLVLSATEEQYQQHLHYLEIDFSEYMKAVEYVKKAWLEKYKEKFVSAWTNKVLHLGNVTTNR